MTEEITYYSMNKKNLANYRKHLIEEQQENPNRYKCKLCNDKGTVYVQNEDGDIVSAHCSCYQSKVAARLGNESGFGVLLDLYDFSNFVPRENFQTQMLKMAQTFCKDENARWFFLGGQSGAGKTHLCTAISKYYINCGMLTRYLPWNEFSTKIKNLYGNPDRYNSLLDEAKNTQVLFIDDLFKSATARETQPTEADIKLAFEIINRRYIDRDKITVVSSEWQMADLLKFDQGTFSRVYQGCGEYKIDISRNSDRNYRFKPII